MKVVPGIWAVRYKRRPDGVVTKFKAQFNAVGHHQVKGLDFFETYALVCQCIAKLRGFLALTVAKRSQMHVRVHKDNIDTLILGKMEPRNRYDTPLQTLCLEVLLVLL